MSECTLLDSNWGAAVEVTGSLLPDANGLLRTGSAAVTGGLWRLRRVAEEVIPPRVDTIHAVSRPVSSASPSPERVTVLVYSHRPEFRAQVRMAVGRRPRPDSPRIEWLECATTAQAVEQLDLGEIELLILDGESQPTGGMGLARQFKYEIDDCPPIVVVVARPQDGWLASWSLADAVLSQPLDPISAATVVVEQLQARLAGVPVIR